MPPLPAVGAPPAAAAASSAAAAAAAPSMLAQPPAALPHPVQKKPVQVHTCLGVVYDILSDLGCPSTYCTTMRRQDPALSLPTLPGVRGGGEGMSKVPGKHCIIQSVWPQSPENSTHMLKGPEDSTHTQHTCQPCELACCKIRGMHLQFPTTLDVWAV